MDKKKDVVRGQINPIILSSLFDGEKYGYEIRKEIEEKTSGKFILKEPTLYSSLKRLEKSGLVESYWGDLEETNGGRRRYYKLTDRGREICERNLNEWEYSRTLMDKLISDREVDLATAEPPEAIDSEITAKVKKNYIRDIDSESVTDDSKFIESESEDRKDLRNVLIEREKDLSEASNVISLGRETFETRIQEIENRSNPAFPTESESIPQQAATFSTVEPIIIDKPNADPQPQTTASAEELRNEFLAAVRKEPESPQKQPETYSVRDYSSFQSVTYAEEADPKITEQVNRFLDERREKQADADSKEYKNRLGKLLSSTKSFTSKAEISEPDDKVISFETASAAIERPVTQSRRTDPLENEDLKALSSKIQAEGFKIKTYSSDSSKEYKSFLLKNKINFFTALILFAVFALEILAFYAFTKSITKQDFMLYGILIGCAALYPLISFIAFRLNSGRKTKAKFSLRESAINCVLIFTLAFLTIMSLNLIFKVQFVNLAELILKVFLPSLVAFQLVVGCLIYGCLYVSQKFHT